MTYKSKLAELIGWPNRLFGLFGTIVGIVAVAIYVVPIYQSHNRAAREVLSSILSEPLPPNTTITKKDWEVGAYEGASNLCEAAAFVVIKSEEPKENILEFYKSRFPAMGKKVDSDFYIASLDDLPPLQNIPGNIDQMAASMTPSDRKVTYVIWGICPVDELGWDIRGW
jgi:hypothetical protein